MPHSDSKTSSRPLPKTHVSSPLLVDPEGLRNVTDLLADRVRKAPDHVCFEVREPGASPTGPWQPISTKEFANTVEGLAKGMMAAGFAPGDTAVIMAPTQYLWAVVDHAILFAGGIVVPVYDTATLPQLEMTLQDARPTFAFVDTHEHGQQLLESGRPKGALITHRNMAGLTVNTAAEYDYPFKDSGNTVLFLPLTHVLGRAVQLVCIASGMRVAHLSSTKDMVPALATVQPTFLMVVPRVLEKIIEAAASSTREKRLGWAWRMAHRTAVAWGRLAERGDGAMTSRPSLGLKLGHAIFDRIFYRRIRALLGGRLEHLLSGAATLRPDISLFFTGIGITVIEGYGLTETTAPLTGGRAGSLVAGTVGVPLPGNEVRIASDGEVEAKGIGVFTGYRRAEDNAEAFTHDGYFRTGDQGVLDDQGRLTLTGRLKDTIITSTGRTVAPNSWEEAVEAHPLVAYATMVGTDRPYLTALIVLDDEYTRLETPRGITRCEDPAITAEIAATITEANRRVSPTEQVQAQTLVQIRPSRMDDFQTPTLKLKRRELMRECAPLADEMYR
ncbi:AMP-dependent synthetase/ligase [Leucobacter insecticola]|uniref:AMP-dependent synthetase/ligase n=1 Tax=Leucobacter insecticola TaxID=2714934 RepID=UPI001FCC4735|nr:AMP-binding protein [Leucobacter insecticola]